MAKDGGDWPIARRARRHLGTPRSRSLPVRGRIPSRVSTPSWLPLTIFSPIFCVSSSRFVFNRGDRQNASILKDPSISEIPCLVCKPSQINWHAEWPPQQNFHRFV
ncbi:hypothetical protein BO85DRAFT_148940 [Aspergillus piperis CBS 112811]|uniref:Uncharacterized protein n=1 Tax=Aspergillus piperis CBS 112811 TaxID=1448313 RepID=A0A8G1QWP1_9EURO|nr:hypothetical protein BO85DRAFT_148940 [Aspergillus piperis CBS 112811]RAH53984.1 hypothetical protein BO85DRAFT_148940 [Aspergillus piperis CBS 112811]